MNFRDRILEELAARGWSIYQLATPLDHRPPGRGRVPARSIYAWLAGTKFLRLDHLEKTCEFLNLDLVPTPKPELPPAEPVFPL